MNGPLKMFHFTVENTRSKQEFAFLGQGTSVEEAFKDGIANCAAPFRPKQDGRPPILLNICVHNPDGTNSMIPLKDFERLPDPVATPVEPSARTQAIEELDL